MTIEQASRDIAAAKRGRNKQAPRLLKSWTAMIVAQEQFDDE